MKARPMTTSHSSTFLNPRSSADSAARADRELNAAIVSADISASDEEFLALVDQFSMPMTHAMTNSFGFGGTNACLIFSAAGSGR